MSVVWVTGISGSGKTSVCAALRARGHEAIDTDGDGFNHWVDRRTGEVLHDWPDPAPLGWLERYAWQIDAGMVAALADRVGSSVVFLCGSVENEVDVWEHFDVVACLVLDDDTIRHRLATRTTNSFGKHPEQLDAVLGWNQTIEQIYRDLGAHIVDATRPLPDVVDELIRPPAGREPHPGGVDLDERGSYLAIAVGRYKLPRTRATGRCFYDCDD